MPRFVLWIGLLFFAIGVGLLGLAMSLELGARKFDAGAARADGVVVDLTYHPGSRSSSSSSSNSGPTYSPVVEWTDPDGRLQRLEGDVASNPPGYSRGDRVKVLFRPSSPEEARIDDFSSRYLGQLIAGGMGAVFALLGGGFSWAILTARRRETRLKASGLPIEARFLETWRDTGITVNGRHPYRVAAQGTHPATGRLCRFESAPIWVDPTAVLSGRGVRVLVDPASEKDYFVDLDDCVAPDDMV